MGGQDSEGGRAGLETGAPSPSVTQGDDAAPGDLVVLRAADCGPFLGQVLEQPAGTGTGGIGILIGELDADGVPQRDRRRPFESASMDPARGRTRGPAALRQGGAAHRHVELVPARGRRPGCGRRLRPAHVPVRPERLGQDLRARRHPGAAPARHGAAHGRARPQRRLRPARAGPAGRAPRRGPTRLAESTSACSVRTAPRRAAAHALRDDAPSGSGGRTAARPARRPRGVQPLPAPDGRRRPRRTSDESCAAAERRPRRAALAQRIENLGMLDWEVWAGERPSAVEVVTRARALTVMDLSGFRTRWSRSP